MSKFRSLYEDVNNKKISCMQYIFSVAFGYVNFRAKFAYCNLKHNLAKAEPLTVNKSSFERFLTKL